MVARSVGMRAAPGLRVVKVELIVPTGELALLVGATAPPGTPAAHAWAGRHDREPVVTTALLGLARTHDMVVPLARSLARGPAFDPDAALMVAARNRTMRSLVLAAELSRLADRFAAAGIPLIALKGPALAQDLFGDPAARDPGDLDLLIRPEHLAAADALLTAAGYLREATLNEAFSSGILLPLLDRDIHIAYRWPDRRIVVELHWRWFHLTEIVAFDPSLIWEGVRPVQLGGTTVLALSPPVQLLYLSFHAAAHQCERLKWLNDLSWLLARLDDATVITAIDHARRLGILNLFLAPLLCAAGLGATVLPPPLAGLSQRRPALRLAALCHAGLEHPPSPSGIGPLHQRLLWHRTDWRFAAHRDHPRRRAFAMRLVHKLPGILVRQLLLRPCRGLYGLAAWWLEKAGLWRC